MVCRCLSNVYIQLTSFPSNLISDWSVANQSGICFSFSLFFHLELSFFFFTTLCFQTHPWLQDLRSGLRFCCWTSNLNFPAGESTCFDGLRRLYVVTLILWQVTSTSFQPGVLICHRWFRRTWEFAIAMSNWCLSLSHMRSDIKFGQRNMISDELQGPGWYSECCVDCWLMLF